ncbi:MAG: hypothetical protein JXD22_15100 [Sedimentisphaerales bacterium]|nr:hypothetical protein [Sedimentisphaerales bacterium]
MKLTIAKEDVWAATIKDQPGSLAGKLEVLAAGGVDLGFVIARRNPAKKGTGVVFVTPIKGANQLAAAKKAGFRKTNSLHSLQVEATDKPGLGALLTGALAAAGVNLRGLSAAAMGRKCVCHMAFDKSADVGKATQILKKL